MKSINVGNIAIHSSSAVCVICRIDKKGKGKTIYGIDCGNNIYRGNQQEWKNILCHKEELHNFEDSIINNITLRRGV